MHLERSLSAPRSCSIVPTVCDDGVFPSTAYRVRTLEGLNFRVEVVAKRLVDAGPHRLPLPPEAHSEFGDATHAFGDSLPRV